MMNQEEREFVYQYVAVADQRFRRFLSSAWLANKEDDEIPPALNPDIQAYLLRTLVNVLRKKGAEKGGKIRGVFSSFADFFDALLEQQKSLNWLHNTTYIPDSAKATINETVKSSRRLFFAAYQEMRMQLLVDISDNLKREQAEKGRRREIFQKIY